MQGDIIPEIGMWLKINRCKLPAMVIDVMYGTNALVVVSYDSGLAETINDVGFNEIEEIIPPEIAVVAIRRLGIQGGDLAVKGLSVVTELNPRQQFELAMGLPDLTNEQIASGYACLVKYNRRTTEAGVRMLDESRGIKH